MDVLDHSCSKLGFGGKMSIDGTYKHPEEQADEYRPRPIADWNLAKQTLQADFPEIESINDQLIANSIPVLLVSIKKDRPGHFRSLHQQLAARTELGGIKMVLYVEHTVDPMDLSTALWRFCNNMDPKRDSALVRIEAADGFHYDACLGLDGTRKTKEFDGFHRDWPNIIVANDETIRSVDAKWESLGIGPFIPSPSLKFKGQLYGEEAVVS
jgi:4-hydroxy-3-polyprenylbenzoate decarboxylase